MITAATEVETLREALHGGVFDYILKPLVFERLQETLANYQQHLIKFEALQSLAQSDVDDVLPRSAQPLIHLPNLKPLTQRDRWPDPGKDTSGIQ